MLRLFKSFKKVLKKTRSLLGGKIRGLFSKPLDEETFDDLERILYEGDLGSTCAIEFTGHIEKLAKKKKDITPDEILTALSDFATQILKSPPKTSPKEATPNAPYVILIVGVNGSGKTTSCAKLAHLYKQEGKKVLLAAADTFRAAAIEQLEVWSKRAGVEFVKGQPKSDPSAVIFDALTRAKARGDEIVIADTAGRLQSKTDLMEELSKIKRVCEKIIPGAPHETLLVLDATTGQNAVDQAQTFNTFTPLTGLILTKLDGSAKGGVILSIYRQLGIPVEFIGTGEKMEDLAPFDIPSYVDALFSSE